jgi:hypothetical protein
LRRSSICRICTRESILEAVPSAKRIARKRTAGMKAGAA